MSRANRRYIRTIVLGVAAMGSLIWMAIDQFDISPEEMLNLFVSTAIGAGGIILAAGLVVLVGVALRKLGGGKRD